MDKMKNVVHYVIIAVLASMHTICVSRQTGNRKATTNTGC